MATQLQTLTSCTECGAAWPDEPARPSLKGGCSGCRREYKRRYNSGNYRKHVTVRRKRALNNYYSKGTRYAKYGITREQFEEMYEKQNGCCAICSREVDESKAHIDHDHSTGVVRGLLCMGCNRALGYLGDSTENVERALVYLNNTKEK